MKRRIRILLLIAILLTGCNMPQGSGPQAWIDAPLDGSSLPLAPYEIVFHAYAAGNPAAVELSINNVVVPLPQPVMDQPLVTVRYVWTPEQAGRYILAVRTQNLAGSWSEPHTHVVEVIAGETITPTWTPTFTPTVTPTMTPTPTLQAGEIFSNVSLSSNVFYRLDAEPTSVTFTVRVNDPAGIKSVDFYFRLQDPDTGETTDWDTISMSSVGGGQYSCTLSRSNSSLTPTSPKTMTLQYQFIVTHPDLSLARSKVFSDVTLKNH